MGAGDPNVVGQTRQRKSRLAFESWPVRRKVAATLVVPIVLATAIGAVRIQTELAGAAKLSVASGNTTVVVPGVEFVNRLDELSAAAASGAPVAEPIARFDESAAALAALIRSNDFDPTVTAALATAAVTAKTARDEFAAGAPPNLVVAKRMDSVASDVSAAIATSTASVDDNAVRPIADRLTTVLAAHRALTTQQVLTAAPDFADSVELRASAAEAAGAEAAAIERLGQLMYGSDTVVLRGQSDVRRAAYTVPLSEPVTPAFTDSILSSADRYRVLAAQLASDLQHTVQSRTVALRSAALRDTAIILGAVLAALVFALGVGRSLIRSIGRLRRGALRVAQVQLPEEIEQLSKGAGVPEIAALPVDTDEEIGQLARAIDDIHLQAVRLASEHGVRLQIGDMFETLSRRSRSLVEEQLVLIETLEHDEDDPGRLDHLFRLDHLATRMRRNGDNLLVLADTVDRHRRMPPVPMPELLRAAISEVEDYRRVVLGHVVDGSVVGAAAADIGHLIAELLDNALQYSPPDSPVSITVSRAVEAGVLVEIADRGLGMPDDDMREANERLAQGGEVTSDTAKRMGLFVVGRLARRHGATVVLRTPAEVTDRRGVTASVHLPGALLELAADVSNTGPFTRAELHPQRVNGSSPHPEPLPANVIRPSGATPIPGALPQRSPGASGVTGVARPPVPPSPPPEPVWPQPESDDGSIYARMTSEWAAAQSRIVEPAVPPVPPVPPEPMLRRTDSGLPIRQRGAHLMPGHVEDAAVEAVDSEPRSDPAKIRDVLSRQLTGVRRGRAEIEDADRRGGADR
jgi:signal transduction histidine kinase